MENKIVSFLQTLGFSPKNGENNVWHKNYGSYEIKIIQNQDSPEKSEIDYGSKILCNRRTTCNFHQDETFVVLECVDRLLEKGYKPQNIELEKSWGMGHTEGYLDIWVKDEQNKSFAMIECKTWGKEYDKYVKDTFVHKNKGRENDGGQIFSYLQQEPKTTKAICYYTSHLNGKAIEYKNAIIHNKEDWANLNQVERFNRWSKTFETNGIFEDDVPLYKIESKALRRKDLKELKREDSEGIYNQFAEILRHNVVSDKPNAFNKIINMFLCKIWDEDRAEDEELKFQTRSLGRDKTDEELLEDLNDLYKAGMNAYLEKDVSDVTKDDFETLLNFVNNQSKKDEFEELYRTLRLYKNNEFAFKEVFDKKSFIDNAKVVREVVELLQDKQLRYSHKQQFLGDFFEKLLNDSIKQEAGQFFTPVPLTQFVVKCLPIKEIIQEKIAKNEPDVLPYVIDYACGTGHFLTEIMDNIDKIIKEDIDVATISKPAIKKDFKIWKETEFEWAEKYIYGIDLDYRLIKASKISCFLNGDGKANLLHANGLAPFYTEDYIGKLRINTNKQDNQQFDILIANPPYSVKAFKPTIKDGDNLFELFSNFSENSSEIECLFVERAKQLIKEGGFAGIVLPVSLLTNDKVYIKTREIILKYFDIKGILALQDNAFMATGTKTVILLMQRRSNTYWEQINLSIKNFFENYKDVTVADTQKAFSKFVEVNYEDLTLSDYISIIQGAPTDTAKNSEFYKEHLSLTLNDLRALEQDKMLYFFLSYTSKLVLANSGEKTEEKQFLGYEFSNRRGQEGINIYKDDNGNIISNLFSDVYNLDTEKLNTYMYRNCVGENIDKQISDVNSAEDHPLKNHIDYCRLSELIDFSLSKFEKVINLNSKKKLKIESKYNQEKFKNLVSYFSSGITYDKTDVSNKKTSNIILTADNINLQNQLDIKKQIFLKSNVSLQPDKKLKSKDIFVCLSSGSKKHVGKIAYITKDEPYYAGGFMGIIRADERVIKPLYLYTILQHPYIKQTLEASSTGNNINNLSSSLNDIKLPLPPMDIQEKIVNEIGEYEEQAISCSSQIKELKQNIMKLMSSSANEEKLGKYTTLLKRGKSPKYTYNSEVQIIKSGQIRGLKEFDFSKKFYADSSMEKDERLLVKGDLLINSTGVGTAGRVNLFDLDGNFFVDSHVAICRLKQNELVPLYALYQLYFKVGFKNIEKMATGQSGQIELAPDTIANIKIPVPDIEEQKKIVARVLPLEKEIERLQKEIDEIPEKKRAVLDKYLK